MDLITKLENKKVTCLIVSPHQDDAVLSCGGLMSKLARKTNVKVLNVFTKAHSKPYTLSTKQFLKNSNSLDAQELYKERAIEDKEVLSSFPVSFVNLDFQDALFRKNKQSSLFGKILPEFDHVYPTYRWHILKGVSKKDPAVEDLKKKLKEFNKKNIIVFAPCGIGGHIDHLITRKACEEVFENVILYSDFPYNSRLKITGEEIEKGAVYKLQPNMKKKAALIKKYKTQFTGLFPNGIIPEYPEIYFTTKEL